MTARLVRFLARAVRNVSAETFSRRTGGQSDDVE